MSEREVALDRTQIMKALRALGSIQEVMSA